MPYTVIVSETFRRWLRALRDRPGPGAGLPCALTGFAEGNFGDHRSVGPGGQRAADHVAQGYRVYYTLRDKTVVFLLCGGNKRANSRNIHRAQQMASEL